MGMAYDPDLDVIFKELRDRLAVLESAAPPSPVAPGPVTGASATWNTGATGVVVNADAPTTGSGVVEYMVDVLLDQVPGQLVQTLPTTVPVVPGVEPTRVSIIGMAAGGLAGATVQVDLPKRPTTPPPPPPPPPTGQWTVVSGRGVDVTGTTEWTHVKDYPGETLAFYVAEGATLRKSRTSNVGQAVFGGGAFTVEDVIVGGWSSGVDQHHGLYMRSGTIRRVIVEEPDEGEGDGNSFSLHGYGEGVAPRDFYIEDLWDKSSHRALLGGTRIPLDNVELVRFTKRVGKLQLGYATSVLNGKVTVTDVDVEVLQFDGANGAFAGSKVTGRCGTVTRNGSFPGLDLSGLTVMGATAYRAYAASAPVPVFAAALYALLA